MHNATELLQRQLHAFADSWRYDSAREVPPWELEGWLEGGVSLFRLIRRLGEQLGNGGEVGGLYAEWLRNAAGPLGLLNQLEARGCFVADAVEFRDAEREARGVLKLPVEAALGESRHATVPEICNGLGGSLPA